MTRLSRFPALVLSAFLQLAPLLRLASTEATAVASPLVAVLRWMVGAAAVAGSCHAVSGATGLTYTGSKSGTNGVTFAGGRASILSGQYGTAKSYSATSLPNGILMSSQGVFTGTPTKSGIFKTFVTGWENSNKSGNSFTAPAITFTISDPPATLPVITQSPTAQTVTEGQAASFSAAATGTPAPTFQWLFKNAPIANAISAQFQIARTTLNDAGDYAVIASNSAGSVTSAPVTLTIIAATKPVMITNQPVGLTVKEGGTAAFSVGTTGTEPITYQWLFQSGVLANETNATLTLANVSTNQAGLYQVRVANSATNLLSDAVMLTVTPRAVVGPFSLGVLPVQAGQFSFTFPVVAGVAYAVEYRDSLGLAGWSLLTNVPPPAATGSATISDPLGATGRFYQVTATPQ
ncbi:MAG TPA: immunoglobulin domain-containing protein [Candidatus Limnocylindria bacterium]|nr:immunoglobulin domain-containing protein [Candidatus Limnocylindria bacterium]